MTTLPDSRADSPVWRAPTYRVPAATGWRLVLWSLLWIAVAFAGSFLFGFFLGVVFGVTGLRNAIPKTDLDAVYGWAGVIGSLGALLIISCNVGSARSSDEARGGHEAIKRPLLVTVIAILLAIYAAPLTLAVFSAFPHQLSKIVAVSWWVAILGFLAMTILAPLAEEFFFRGWLWDALRRSWGPAATATLTSLLWLLTHAPEGGVARMTLLVPAAIALSYARHRGGSVWASIIVHMCNNVAVAIIPWLAVWLGWLPWP